jgi:hypothetical protein
MGAETSAVVSPDLAWAREALAASRALADGSAPQLDGGPDNRRADGSDPEGGSLGLTVGCPREASKPAECREELHRLVDRGRPKMSAISSASDSCSGPKLATLSRGRAMTRLLRLEDVYRRSR